MKKKRKKGKLKTAELKSRDFYFTGILFSLLFIGMIGYYVYFVHENGNKMIDNSYNSRQYILAGQNTRGTIYSADGQVLAETLIGEDGKETRVYPFENLFAHAVGFSTKGRTGVEAQANSYLIQSNIPLAEKIENEIAVRKNPGDSVYTSLRCDLQEIADRSLGVYQGAILVSNVKTGEILAMVSKPDFNPNTIVQDWQDYVEEEGNSVLLNRATQGIYPPGSTFKIVTSLAYLRQEGENWRDYRFNCSGTFPYGNSRITCYHGAVHNQVDYTSSFAKSCNCSFANMGLKLDRSLYQDLITRLGFNDALPVDFNYSKSNLTVDETVTDEDMIQISFGQGRVEITPLHLHLITNAIANGGTPMKPQLINRVESVNNELVKSFSPEAWKALMTQEEAEVLRDLMTSVVTTGTARKLNGLSYTAAGKTGSAEYNLVKEDSHAWFTGFAPAQNPEISVTIIVERIGSGGDYAVPIAKRLFDAYFGN